jgi:uncharacterized protein YndB with AHSA1/START domain
MPDPRKASASLPIEAPIHQVWKVMTTVEEYDQWNPFIIGVETSTTEMQTGTKMKLQVQMPQGGNKATPTEVVRVVEPPHETAPGVWEARWVYDFADIWLTKTGMVQGTRLQRLTQQNGGPTEYFTEESFTGWAKAFIPLAQVQAGFDLQAKALQETCQKSQ